MSENKSALSSMNPTQTFVLGLAGGILILCTIGFFVLLSIMLGGKKSADASDRVAVNTGSQPSPSAAEQGSGQISLRAVSNDEHIRGNKNAKVTIVEYSDFECPFCASFHPTMQQVIDKYGDDVRWVYRHFPLESIHPKARQLANASECAAEQGKFWEMADAVFADSGAQELAAYVAEVGLNANKFNACMSANKYDSEVTADAQDAIAAGGRGTPYSVIIGPDGETAPLSGAQPFSQVEAALKQFLN